MLSIVGINDTGKPGMDEGGAVATVDPSIAWKGIVRMQLTTSEASEDALPHPRYEVALNHAAVACVVVTAANPLMAPD